MLVNLLDEAPRDEPVMRIHKSYMALNACASRLLQLAEGDRISIRKDRSGNLVYIGKANGFKQSYGVKRRDNTYLIYSAPLTRKVAECLEGKGAYRICPEDVVELFGNKFFNIFKKKYGNK